MSEKLKALIYSRRFWVAAAAMIYAASSGLGLDVDQQTIETVCLVAASWILGDSLNKTA